MKQRSSREIAYLHFRILQLLSDREGHGTSGVAVHNARRLEGRRMSCTQTENHGTESAPDHFVNTHSDILSTAEEVGDPVPLTLGSLPLALTHVLLI